MKQSDPAVIELLCSRGLRPTRASRLILARLRHSNDHLNAEEIRRALRRQGHEVSIATLYQNLKRLVKAGLLEGFTDPGGLVRFDANTAPHAHLACTGCGQIIDLSVTDPLLNRLDVTNAKPARQYRGWTIQSARLELSGLCPRCRR